MTAIYSVEGAPVRVAIRGQLPHWSRETRLDIDAFTGLRVLEKGERRFLVAERRRLKSSGAGGELAVEETLPEGAVVRIYYETVKYGRALIAGLMLKVVRTGRRTVTMDVTVPYLLEEEELEKIEELKGIKLEVENLEPIPRLTEAEFYIANDQIHEMGLVPSRFDPVQLLWREWIGEKHE